MRSDSVAETTYEKWGAQTATCQVRVWHFESYTIMLHMSDIFKNILNFIVFI